MGSDILILYSKRGCIDTGMTGVGVEVVPVAL